MSRAKKTYLVAVTGLSLLLTSTLIFTYNSTLKAQIAEIEEPTGNLTGSAVLNIDLEEPLPPNGTVIVDIMGIDDINVDGVPPLGMTLLVQNDTITITDQNVVLSNDVASEDEPGNNDPN
jgi:hypothetical protein